MTDHDPTGHDAIDVRSDQFAIVPVWLYEATIEHDDGLHRLSRDAVALYGLLAGKYANRSGHAFPTHQRLAVDLAASRRSVMRWLEELVAVGAVARTPGRPGVATRYDLIASRTVAKSAAQRASRVTPQSPASDTSVTAAGTPVSHEPEDLINQKGSDRPARGSGAAAPPVTHLGRALDAPPQWELDDDGNARPVDPTHQPTPVHPQHHVAQVEATDEGRASLAAAREAARAASKGRHPTGKDPK